MTSYQRKQVYACADQARVNGLYPNLHRGAVGEAIVDADRNDLSLRTQRANGIRGIPEVRTERGTGTCPGYFGTRVPSKGNRNKTRP